ncbi:hypothetical protein PoB_003947600 [Plakobranchus ocellatus]|uniref:Uncharacterized protein n=1 Tax=Plakobranchus ocellatus TaxID=259542 RepID=A0AAV4AP73_9GAST|nr:hypothetical protein PoB_003947600 [Plakobranchus ocellatus]
MPKDLDTIAVSALDSGYFFPQPAWRVLNSEENPYNETMVAYRMSDLKNFKDGYRFCNQLDSTNSHDDIGEYKDYFHNHSQPHVLSFVPQGRVTCLVNDSVSEAEKVSGELKGHGWDCYHCVSHELFERNPGYVGAKDLTLGLSVSMNYISYSTTSSTDEVLHWIKLRSVCLCE